mmetsp:Transcript_10540/g.23209  ORF Transcript_10540/g.23209 Transcript_10540/m.23209 type:complete len:350 (-) Transcript_10540:61-1110(-)
MRQRDQPFEGSSPRVAAVTRLAQEGRCVGAPNLWAGRVKSHTPECSAAPAVAGQSAGWKCKRRGFAHHVLLESPFSNSDSLWSGQLRGATHALNTGGTFEPRECNRHVPPAAGYTFACPLAVASAAAAGLSAVSDACSNDFHHKCWSTSGCGCRCRNNQRQQAGVAPLHSFCRPLTLAGALAVAPWAVATASTDDGPQHGSSAAVAAAPWVGHPESYPDHGNCLHGLICSTSPTPCSTWVTNAKCGPGSTTWSSPDTDNRDDDDGDHDGHRRSAGAGAGADTAGGRCHRHTDLRTLSVVSTFASGGAVWAGTAHDEHQPADLTCHRHACWQMCVLAPHSCAAEFMHCSN